MYYDDYFSEPCEFEKQVMEFKESLVRAVKNEYQEEMARLRKENEYLMSVKERLEEMEEEHKQAMNALTIERQVMEMKMRSKRLHELLSDNFVHGWSACSRSVPLPKCGKCNDFRVIQYTTPLGKIGMETCDCNRKVIVYEVVEEECYCFRWNGYDEKVDKFYRRIGSGNRNETYDLCTIWKGQDFKLVNGVGNTIFLNREKCEEYCRWLNSEQKN